MGYNFIDIIFILLLAVMIFLLVMMLRSQKKDAVTKEILSQIEKSEARLAAQMTEQESRLDRELSQTEERLDREINQLKLEVLTEIKTGKTEIIGLMQSSFSSMASLLTENQKEAALSQDRRLTEINRKFGELVLSTEQKLDNIRNTMEARLTALNEDNTKQLELMRSTVDEKLQKTLEDRISQSFKLVSERLEEVYKGLGEMQTLASGVGDLKKVLSNVKTRGILGEIQLSAILEQILSKEQYDTNVATKQGSSERVEFAVKLPGEGEKPVYLPIDAKFPADTYSRLVDAYESGNTAEIEAAAKALITRIKQEAKDIKDKYIYPPDTTDFAIMFLPVEGLYAEAVRRGLVEILQRDYKVNIAGPTTMAALLNSLQMGFKTLAVQKHSSQVWDVLGAVKTEFDKFGTVLAKTQDRLRMANEELDKLVGTRTNVIRQKLRNVQMLPQNETVEILGGSLEEGTILSELHSEK